MKEYDCMDIAANLNVSFEESIVAFSFLLRYYYPSFCCKYGKNLLKYFNWSYPVFLSVCLFTILVMARENISYCFI